MPKTWGPKREQHQLNGDVSSAADTILPAPKFPDDERLNSDEWMQVQQFQSFWRVSKYIPHFLTSRLSSFAGVPFFCAMDSDLNVDSSALFRSSILVLMSCLKNTDTSQVAVTAKHLVNYHREAQKCIEAGSLAELTYCSYVVTIYSIIRGESLQMAMRYCRQFCRSFVELTKKQNFTDEWIEMLWRDSLMSLNYVHRDIVLYDCMSNIAPSMEFVLLWEELLDASSCLLVSEDDIANLPISMSIKTEQICHKIKSLSVYMHLSFDQFLFRAKLAENTEEMELARSRLYSVLDRILRLMAYLPGISDYIYRAYKTEPYPGPINDATASTFLQFAEVHPRGLDVLPITRDTGLALLYAFSRLLKNLLEPTTDVEEEIYHSATAICRLCANIPIGSLTETLIVKRSLFWAGLILTETRSLPGQ